MGDASNRENWAGFLRRITGRTGWSVARLARESGVHRGTIFNWLKGDAGESVTIGSVLAIAEAAGEHPLVALRAAAGLVEDGPDDAEIAAVLGSSLPDDKKTEIIDTILDRRERDRERRMQDTVQMIRLAGGAA